MRWWITAWQLIKDVALTGTGLLIIERQIFARSPSDVLLVVGLALTVPAAASHAKSVLSGPSVPSGEPGDGGTASSSPSSDAPGEPPSRPSSSTGTPPPPSPS